MLPREDWCAEETVQTSRSNHSWNNQGLDQGGRTPPQA